MSFEYEIKWKIHIKHFCILKNYDDDLQEKYAFELQAELAILFSP